MHGCTIRALIVRRCELGVACRPGCLVCTGALRPCRLGGIRYARPRAVADEEPTFGIILD